MNDQKTDAEKPKEPIKILIELALSGEITVKGNVTGPAMIGVIEMGKVACMKSFVGEPKQFTEEKSIASASLGGGDGVQPAGPKTGG